MSYLSATDEDFLSQLKQWLDDQRELLLFIRYSASAGAKDFEFFRSIESLMKRLHSLPAVTCTASEVLM